MNLKVGTKIQRAGSRGPSFEVVGKSRGRNHKRMERYDALPTILTITPRRITDTLCNAKIQPLQQNERLNETYLLFSSTDGTN